MCSACTSVHFSGLTRSPAACFRANSARHPLGGGHRIPQARNCFAVQAPEGEVLAAITSCGLGAGADPSSSSSFIPLSCFEAARCAALRGQPAAASDEAAACSLRCAGLALIAQRVGGDPEGDHLRLSG